MLRLGSLLVISAIVSGYAQDFSEIRCPEGRRPTHDLFQVVTPLADFETGLGTWDVVVGGQQAAAKADVVRDQAHGGHASLRLAATFKGSDGLEYLEVAPKIVLDKPGMSLGFWYREEGAQLGLRLRIRDSSGETHQINLPREGTDSPWRFTAAEILPQASAWGGDGNHKLDYPCMLHSIVGDRPQKGFAGTSVLWLDDVAVLKRRTRESRAVVAVSPKRLGNVYRPGEAIGLRVKAKAGTVRCSWKDFAGATVREASSDSAALEMSFMPPRQGWYACRIEIVEGGRVQDVRVYRCAVLPENTGSEPNDFLGFCTHFQRYTSWPIEGLDLFARYGFHHLRDEIGWAGVERDKGQYDIPVARAAFLSRAKELRVEPLLIFDYGNPHYDDAGFPNSPGAVAGYAKWCAFMAKTLRDRVTQWEVWNEWTVRCGMHGKPGENTPERYAVMCQAAYAAVKAVDPALTVVGLGGEHSGRHRENIKGMMAHGAATSMDAFSVHSYRYPRTPEESDLFGEITSLGDIAETHGAPPEVWVTEIGWPTHTGPRGVDERTQACMLVRTMALLQATGVVHRVYWYDFKNDGHRRDYNENNFGVVWHQDFNWAPKPAVVAASVFAELTAGATCTGLRRIGSIHAVAYRLADERDLLIAWAPDGAQTVSVSGESTSVQDMMGVPLPGMPVELTAMPIYISGRGIELKKE